MFKQFQVSTWVDLHAIGIVQGSGIVLRCNQGAPHIQRVCSAGVTSTYVWENKVETETECLLLIKTQKVIAYEKAVQLEDGNIMDANVGNWRGSIKIANHK